MADIPITWNKIRRGLPRARTYEDDRIPTIENTNIKEIYLDMLFLQKLINGLSQRITNMSHETPLPQGFKSLTAHHICLFIRALPLRIILM